MPAESVRLLRLMFLGAPGVGKGTYAQRLCRAVDMPYVSSGDLLRSEVAANTQIGVRIKEALNSGSFVDDALVESMVVTALKNFNADAGFLLDGFPRNLQQAQSMARSGVELDYVVNLRQPFSVIVAKLAARRICPQCGFNYNYASIDEAGIKMDPLVPKTPGRCDQCSFEGEFVARDDDRPEVVKARLEKYQLETKPLEEYYHSKGQLVVFDVLGGAKQYLPKLIDTLTPLRRHPKASAGPL